MEITDVKIRRIFTEGELRAIMSVTFDAQLVVHDVKLIKSGDRIIVAMPNRKTTTGFIDIVHPVNADFRAIVEREVKNAYNAQADVTDKIPID